jgi:hypothetical protein
MKKFILLSLLSFSFGYSQSLPLTFENAASTANFIDFNGGTATLVANPLKAGINVSDTVVRLVRNGGAIWAGSKIILAANLDFSVLTKISAKVYTTAPVGTIAKLKLEGTSPSVEVDAFTTASGAWQTLEWVFAGAPNDFNEVVFMFDYGTVGNGSTNSTFYFDDIAQVQGPPAPVRTTLPINFESSVTSNDFLNFSGGTASVIANPQPNGINTSNTVAQMVRNGGAIWAGSTILLDSNLDLSAAWHLSMKVFTTAPVGTRVKLELAGPTTTASLDVFTTTTGAWETLNFNFYGQPNIFNRLAFLFDFGNLGNGSAASTFLFDDVQQFVGPALPTPNANPLPLDFEQSVVSSDFINQFGATGSVVPNPQMGVGNNSATVGHIIKSGGQPWARTKLILTQPMDFSNKSAISMKVYTDAPVGTMLKFKVESTTSAAANERDAFTTVSGGWATYTWDFAGDPPIYDVVTFMLGYGSIGDASPASTFLIDDVQQVAGPPPAPKASLPITFENMVNTNYFTDFDGAGVTVIANPQKGSSNPSDSAAKMVRNGGQVYAGSKIELSNNLDFSTLGYISMKVFTQAPVGTLLKLKLEGAGALQTEVDVLTTVSNAWETLLWDFTGQPSNFNSLVFMFDFGAVGDSSATSTFLFDDIRLNNAAGTVGIEKLTTEVQNISSFPNPAKGFLTISSTTIDVQSISLFDVLGNKVLERKVNGRKDSFDVSDLAPGVYVALVATKKGVASLKLIIE